MSERPYPNVIRAEGSNRWEARLPSNGRQLYLGLFDTPEAARHAVLIAQAERLETKAAIYRTEADMVQAHLGPYMKAVVLHDGSANGQTPANSIDRKVTAAQQDSGP